jgi:hypothetical protein
MKQQTNILNRANSQIRKDIKDELSGTFGTIIGVNNTLKIRHLMEGDEGSLSIFLTQNKGKGPPGRIRSPETGCILKPDKQPAVPESSKTNYNTTTKQQFNKYQISNFNYFLTF